jgi:hypothetical protein
MKTGQQFCEEAQWYRTEETGYGFTAGGDTITRYAEMPANVQIAAAIAYLVGADGCSKLTMDGKAISGTWRTAVAGCAPIGPENAGRSRPMRLFHTMAKVGGVGTGWAETNCTFVVTVTPYFKVAAVTSPAAGTSGITYSIEGARRDDRTGLWDYLLVKREQLTTTTGIVKTEDDKFKTVSEQTFYGVRTGNLNHLGAAVALWTVGVDPDGTEYETVSVRKNDNCTTDISQRKTVAKAVTDQTVANTQTVFDKTESATDRNQEEAVNALVTVAGGVVTERRSEENEDGTFNNTETKKTAIAVTGAVEANTQTIFEKSESKTDRNQSAAVKALVTVAGGVVTERRAETNPDGTFDNVETKKTAIAVTGAVEANTQTVFEKQESKTDRNQAAAVKALVTVAGGVVTERRSEENEDGTFNNTETKKTAIAVTGAVEANTQTIFEKSESKTDRNQSAAVKALVTVAGGVVTERRAEENPDGTFDNVETKKTAIAVTGAVEANTQTIFEKSESKTDRNQAAAVKALVAVSAGVITQRKAETNPDGTFDNVETKNTEVAVSEAVKEQTGDLFSARVRVASKNTTADATTPGLSGAGTAGAKIVTVINEKTPGGLVSPTKVEDTPGPATVETVDVPYDGDKTVKLVIFRNHTKTALQALITAATYYRVSASVSLNQFGLLDGILTLSIDAGGGGGDGAYVPIYDKAITKERAEIVSYGGKWYKRVSTYTITVRRDWGLDDGLTRYSGTKAGGEFKPLSGNWYYFEKVTAISVSDTAVTMPLSAVAL